MPGSATTPPPSGSSTLSGPPGVAPAYGITGTATTNDGRWPEGVVIVDAATGLPLVWSGSGGAASATLTAGTLGATTSAVALNGGASLACSEVYVQNDPASAASVLLGSGTTQVIVLAPGSGFSVQVANVTTVSVKTAAGTATVNWIARS